MINELTVSTSHAELYSPICFHANYLMPMFNTCEMAINLIEENCILQMLSHQLSQKVFENQTYIYDHMSTTCLHIHIAAHTVHTIFQVSVLCVFGGSCGVQIKSFEEQVLYRPSDVPPESSYLLEYDTLQLHNTHTL